MTQSNEKIIARGPLSSLFLCFLFSCFYPHGQTDESSVQRQGNSDPRHRRSDMSIVANSAGIREDELAVARPFVISARLKRSRGFITEEAKEFLKDLVEELQARSHSIARRIQLCSACEPTSRPLVRGGRAGMVSLCTSRPDNGTAKAAGAIHSDSRWSSRPKRCYDDLVIARFRCRRACEKALSHGGQGIRWFF